MSQTDDSNQNRGTFQTILMIVLVCLVGAPSTGRGQEGILDFNRFMVEIEPLLLTQQYASPGPTPMTCFACHGGSNADAFSAFPLAMGEPRNNFIESGRHISLDDPDTSFLLLKPLAIAAGGVPHGVSGNEGGEQFPTTADDSYTTILNWIQDAKQANVGARITRTEPHPNPFRFHTDIVYFLSTEALSVEVTIYSMNGRRLRNFVGPRLVGANRVRWDGRDSEFEPMPTDVYFYSVEAKFADGTAVSTGQMVYTP